MNFTKEQVIIGRILELVEPYQEKIKHIRHRRYHQIGVSTEARYAGMHEEALNMLISEGKL